MNEIARFALEGAAALADETLLALILGGRDGGRDRASQLLAQHRTLDALSRAEPDELRNQAGLTRQQATRVLAALHLGRRSLRRHLAELPTVCSPESAFQVFAPSFTGCETEELHAIYLDRRRRLLARRSLSRGSDQFTVVDPRQIYRPALRLGASAVILAHNHPSGDPTPSHQDREVTRRVGEAGRILGISLLDHLVIADERFVSLAAEGAVPPPGTSGLAWTA